MLVTKNAEQWLREELHDYIEHLQSVEASQRLSLLKRLVPELLERRAIHVLKTPALRCGARITRVHEELFAIGVVVHT